MKWKEIIVNHLIKKQDNLCRICDQPFSSVAPAEIDHIVSKKKGGKDELDNLQLVHHICNVKKGTKPFKKNNIYPINLNEILRTKEKFYLEDALNETNTIKEAANILGISYRAIRYLIDKHKIQLERSWEVLG